MENDSCAEVAMQNGTTRTRGRDESAQPKCASELRLGCAWCASGIRIGFFDVITHLFTNTYDSHILAGGAEVAGSRWAGSRTKSETVRRPHVPCIHIGRISPLTGELVAPETKMTVRSMLDTGDDEIDAPRSVTGQSWLSAGDCGDISLLLKIN